MDARIKNAIAEMNGVFVDLVQVEEMGLWAVRFIDAHGLRDARYGTSKADLAERCERAAEKFARNQ